MKYLKHIKSFNEHQENLNISDVGDNKKYEVVFYDYSDDETVVKQKFNTESEAEEWAIDLEYKFQDIAIDKDGYDYWETFYRYYNPEDKESYFGYSVRECNTCL
jgi:hypothetical protein